MDHRETRFLKTLIDGGRLSFKAAADLEAERGQADVSGQPVWDLAVEKGLITQQQADEVLMQISGGSKPAAEGRGVRTDLGNYELLGRLGQGGMGAVYKARQKSMDRVVALKVLPKNLARNQNFITRFLREARAAGKLAHPNIVTGIDAGVIDGYYYFAMEYVDGRNLGDRVRQDGPLSEKDVIEIGRQLSDALEYAHSRGMVHRDVKPENILLTNGGVAKLCDLGLARSNVADDEELRLTQAGCAVGTPYYISPEQVRGGEPDARSDIYSLGCSLYHLASGRPPFQGNSPMATMQMHLTETAVRLTEANPDMSRALESVIERMMARDPAERYQTARAAADDFCKMAAGGVPAALTSALAERRRVGGPRLDTTRKGLGGSTAATGPIGRRGIRTAIEPPVFQEAGATADTRPLNFVGRMQSWQLVTFFAIGALVAGGGGFLGIRWLRDRKAARDSAVVERPPDPVPTEDPLKALREKLAGARDYEVKRPTNFVEISTLYEKLLQEPGVAGTEVETAARQAIEETKRRQAAHLLAERTRLLAEELERARAFEASNQERLDEILARYAKLAADAAGTSVEEKAKAAGAEARRQHSARAVKALVDLDRRVDQECGKGALRAAMAAIDGFPKGYVGSVERDLAALRDKVLAEGRRRWATLRRETEALTKAGRFDEAARTAARGRDLGLSALDSEVAESLAAVEAARTAADQARTAAAEKAFGRYCAELPALFAARQYAEARKRGEALTGTLTSTLETRLRAELELVTGAEAFMKNLRTGLRAVKADQIKMSTPVGEGFLQSYDPASDALSVKVSMGNSSMITEVRMAEVGEADLLRLAAKAAGGELDTRAMRGAACLLLSCRRIEGVAELLDKAAAGGEKVDALRARLAELEKAAAPPPPPPAEPKPAE